MAAITLVRLLSTVHSLVSVQVVALNEPHITRVTSIWLFSCVCENMSFEVVATPESSIAVVTDEVLLDFQGKVVVIIHVHLWKDMLHFLFHFVG